MKTSTHRTSADFFNFNIGNIVIDNVVYPGSKIKKLALKYYQQYRKSQNQFVVMFDKKTIWTFSSVIATVLCHKTFVFIPATMDDKNRENVMRELGVDYIQDENSLKDLIKSEPEPELQIKDITAIWNASDQDFISYILYTSGTTGVPKGVEMPFNAVFNTFISLKKKFSINSSNVVINLARWSFDLSIFDFFCTLFLGSKMVCISDPKNTQTVHDAINNYKNIIWNSTPQVLGMYMRYLDIFKKGVQRNVLIVMVSGDKFDQNICELVRKYFDHAKIISLGGATECAIWSVYYDCSDGFSEAIAPYGYALSGQKVEIVHDKNGAGEIVISGKGVALGYLNNPLKTAEHFKTENGERKYYTGDLGYFDSKGCLFIEGRKDSQVKINGKRYKLGEIAKMFTVKNTRNPICIVNDSKTKLGVFIQKNSLSKERIQTIINNSLLKEVLNIRDVIELRDFPITENGKIDGKTLKEIWHGR